MLLTAQSTRAVPDAGRPGYSEHLLIWSWRRIVGGRIHCPVMAREFGDVCGNAGDRVFVTLCTFLRALGAASRRHLAFSAPNPFDVTADERQVLTLLAAAQADDHALVQAHLRWLARPQQRQELQRATYTLATTLRASNLPLALPSSAMPDRSEQPRVAAPGTPR